MSHLINMANDIGNFFRIQPHDQAVSAIANHIKSYWTRRMRDKLIFEIQHSEDGDEPLDELPREALRFLVDHPGFKASTPPGGDAG
jgi:formate dehydrogenase subunit delta